MAKALNIELTIKLAENWNMGIVTIPDQVMSHFGHEKGFRVKLFVGENYISAAITKRSGKFHIMVSKKSRLLLGLKVGQSFQAMLKEEDSPYGMDLPEEIAEMLKLDPEGDKAFHALTPGRQRSAIHFVIKAKSEKVRVDRTILIFDNLKLGFTDPLEFTKKQ